MIDTRTTLTQNMVAASTEFGINVVQEMALQALRQKPGMSLRDFVQILNHQMLTVKNTITASVEVKTDPA